MSSSSFNPLSAILNQNKLNGQNYVDWKRNLDIVLTAEGYKFVLNTTKPDEPDSEATQEVKDKHDKWVKANDMAKCYILASMSNVLQHQHQYYTVASDIMFNLRKMPKSQGRLRGRRPCDSILSSRMSESSPVQGHLFRMFFYYPYFLEILEDEILSDISGLI